MRNFLITVCAILVTHLLATHLQGQVAGYRVGTQHLQLRAIPCEDNFGDKLCQPSGGVYLRIRNGTLVEIDTNFFETETNFITAPDVWSRLQPRWVSRFGTPDSVRIMNSLKLPKAFSDGIAAFWTKRGWCVVLTLKTSTSPEQSGVFIPIDVTVEKHGTWGQDCSVYPYLEPSR